MKLYFLVFLSLIGIASAQSPVRNLQISGSGVPILTTTTGAAFAAANGLLTTTGTVVTISGTIPITQVTNLPTLLATGTAAQNTANGALFIAQHAITATGGTGTGIHLNGATNFNGVANIDGSGNFAAASITGNLLGNGNNITVNGNLLSEVINSDGSVSNAIFANSSATATTISGTIPISQVANLPALLATGTTALTKANAAVPSTSGTLSGGTLTGLTTVSGTMHEPSDHWRLLENGAAAFGNGGGDFDSSGNLIFSNGAGIYGASGSTPALFMDNNRNITATSGTFGPVVATSYNGNTIPIGTGTLGTAAYQPASEITTTAIGDGTTDATAQLQADINTAELTHTTLKLPAGTFKITSPLVISDAITIAGAGIAQLPGSANVTGTADSINIPGTAPYIVGTVLLVSSSNINAINITSTGASANLRDFGIRFSESIKFSHTGHGIYAMPPILSGSETFRDNGIQGSDWKNLFVYGGDGNHYAFYVCNGLYNNQTNIQAWGGGGWCFEQNGKTTAPYNQLCGNKIVENASMFTIVSGSCHAFYIKKTAGNPLHFCFLRPQGLVLNESGILGITAPTSAQSTFWADDGTDFLSIITSAFESTVNSKVRFPASMCAFFSGPMSTTSDQATLGTRGVIRNGFGAMPMILSNPLSWGPSFSQPELIRFRDDSTGFYEGIGLTTYTVQEYMQATSDSRFGWEWGQMSSSHVFTRFNFMSDVDGSIVFGGTDNVLPNQVVSSGSSIVTKNYSDATYATVAQGAKSDSAVQTGTSAIPSLTLSKSGTGNATTLTLSGTLLTSATSTAPSLTLSASNGVITLSGTQVYLLSKSSGTARSNTSTFADDPDLIVNLAPGVYDFECVCWSRATTFTAGIKVQMAFSGTYTGGNLVALWDNGGGTVSIGAEYGSITHAGIGSTTDARWFRQTGSLTVTVAGNLSLQWAQTTALLSDTTTLSSGSFLHVTRK